MIQTECRGFRTISDTGKKIDPKSLVKAYQGIPNVFLQKTSDRDIDTAMGFWLMHQVQCGEKKCT